jgi:hypothetical protein
MFDFLEVLEKYSYRANKNREWFVDMCDTKDIQELTFDSYLFKEMAKVSPLVHGRMAVNGVKAALRNWMNPRTPLATAPPQITAKEALLITRAAVADGQSVDDQAFAHAG